MGRRDEVFGGQRNFYLFTYCNELKVVSCRLYFTLYILLYNECLAFGLSVAFYLLCNVVTLFTCCTLCIYLITHINN